MKKSVKNLKKGTKSRFETLISALISVFMKEQVAPLPFNG